jgi:hypothetical protein
MPTDKELNPCLLDEIEAFFRDYDEMDGKEFEPIKHAGPNAALGLIEEARSKEEGFGKEGGSLVAQSQTGCRRDLFWGHHWPQVSPHFQARPKVSE